jgi:hypothetical protein
VKVRGSFFEPVANSLVDLQNFVFQRFLLRSIPKLSDAREVRLGTYYGGWWLPELVTKNPEDFMFISCGLGHDVSFDLELLKLGIPVLGVEAEERFIREIKDKGLESEKFLLIHARVGVEKSSEVSLPELIRTASSSFGRRRVGVKMDIESAEYEVLSDVINSKIFPDILNFELDYMSLISFFALKTRLFRFRKSRKLILNLAKAGYFLYKSENWNLHFCRVISL